MMCSRKIEAYESTHASAWNSFVASSANGSFLFDRNFMEYHADRFTDASLIILDDTEIVGLLPASISGAIVTSHGGLTYGGLVLGQSRASSEAVYTTLSEVCNQLKSAGAQSFIYKSLPHMYHKEPSEADLHALFRLGAKLTRRDLSSAIAPSMALRMRKGRKALVQRAKKVAGLHIAVGYDWAVFHCLLKNRLKEKYQTYPVHSPSELEMLQALFPQNIELIAASLNGKMIAGCVVFESECVVHAQYLATDDEAREIGAMDLLLSQIIETALDKSKWFDFGISTTDGGQILNAALASYKEGFGAKSVVYDWYRIDF